MGADGVSADAGMLRVGHRERQATVVTLRDAAAQGRLDPVELAERTQAALAARTYSDLARLVADLPPLPGPDGRPSYRPSSVGTSPNDRLSFAAGISSHHQRGVWEVPPYLRVSAGLASVKVDFLLARCPYDIVDVQVQGGAGSVTLVLPPGWAADVTRVGKGWGSVSCDVPAVPAPGFPLLLVHGQNALGSVKVRGGGRLERRWADKALRRAPRAALPPAPPPGVPPTTPTTPTPPAPPAGPQDASPQEWERR